MVPIVCARHSSLTPEVAASTLLYVRCALDRYNMTADATPRDLFPTDNSMHCSARIHGHGPRRSKLGSSVLRAPGLCGEWYRDMVWRSSCRTQNRERRIFQCT